MFGGQNWKVKKMASQTKGLIQRLPSEYVGTNVFIGASAMSKPELRRRYVNGLDAPDVGHRLPPSRGHLAQHRSSGCRTDFRTIPVEETRLLLGLNAVRCYDLDLDGLSAHRGRHRADPRAAQPGPRRCGRPPNAIREARFWFDDYGIDWKD